MKNEIIKYSGENAFSEAGGKAMEVPPKVTKLSKNEAMSAIGGAFSKVFGWSPSNIQRAMLTAQWANETGWGSRMMNYNFAGLKGRDPKSGGTTCYVTMEGHGADAKKVDQYFRAYENAEDGAEDYLRLLKSKNYDKALDGLKDENVYAFVAELKASGYFTGDFKTYYKNILSITRDLAGEDMKRLEASRALQKKHKEVANKKVVRRKRSSVELDELAERFLKLAK